VYEASFGGGGNWLLLLSLLSTDKERWGWRQRTAAAGDECDGCEIVYGARELVGAPTCECEWLKERAASVEAANGRHSLSRGLKSGVCGKMSTGFVCRAIFKYKNNSSGGAASSVWCGLTGDGTCAWYA